MLTTGTAAKIRENVSPSDPNANVTVPAANGGVQSVSPEAALMFNKGVVARPLMVPEVCSLHIKNTEYRYRWVNRAAMHGQKYMERKAQGFINATSDDVDVLGGDATATKAEITAGDVILMKIRADLYDGAIKYNMYKANVLQKTRGMYLQGGSSDVNSDAVAEKVTMAQGIGAKTGLAKPFIPDNPDAIVENSIKSGRAEEARAVVEDLRASRKE